MVLTCLKKILKNFSRRVEAVPAGLLFLCGGIICGRAANFIENARRVVPFPRSRIPQVFLKPLRLLLYVLARRPLSSGAGLPSV
jgi:hypothetical protein